MRDRPLQLAQFKLHSLRLAILATANFVCFTSDSAKADHQEPLSPKKYNVLLLISDDMNSWLLDDKNRFTGKVIAPNLRRLASSGIQFKHAYTAAPVCSPSRTAFFSGVAPWKSGHYHNVPGANTSKPLGQALSLAGLFHQSGYTTAGFGKITHGWDQKEHWDIKVGHKRDPAPPGAPLTSVGRGEQDWGPIHLSEQEMNDSLNANRAIEILNKPHGKPFFLCYGTFNPHMPWYVPQRYFDMYPLDEIQVPQFRLDDLDDVPELGRELNRGKRKFVDAVLENKLHRQAVQAYLATMTYVDTQMGRVLNALEASPYSENTIVVYLTDHGFHLAEKGHWQKATLWEEATHTLLTIHVPGNQNAGKSCSRYVSLLDIYPTLIELCGIESNNSVDGRSLVPLLNDPNAPWTSTAMTGLTSKSGPWKSYVSLRNHKGRYTRYATGQEEYYDTSKDPREWTNQIDNPNYLGTVEAMRRLVPLQADMAVPLPASLSP